MRLEPTSIVAAAILVASLAPVCAGDPLTLPAESKMRVAPAVGARAYAFHLNDVRLLNGPFKHAQELDRAYLLSLDADRLLHNFRVTSGLPSAAQPLGGWEAPNCELRGHFVGHYLSACAMMWASTGDVRLKERAAYIVAELAKCQERLAGGYLSAFPEEFFDRLEAGRRVWAPWYTLHKILAGLIDAHVLCDNEQALAVARKFCGWVKARTDRLSDAEMQKTLNVEHGGMNDALAEMYAVTGDQAYLALARRFNHKAVLDPLARCEDKLTGLHANTQFPKVIGAARQYELAGDVPLRTAAEFFWNVVTKERSYVIGGNSDGEHFSPKERLSQALGPNTAETCNTYNMLKLTRHLFAWEPRADYADYCERALYNHILASQNPETGMMCYYVPLRSGSRKTFCGPLDAFWCCTGTGVENHARYGESIYFHDGERGLFVNLFIASELTWRSQGVRLRQETAFPDEASARLVLTCEKPVELALHVRRPWWADAGFQVAVNGAPQRAGVGSAGFVTLARTWNTGDTVEIRVPMTVRTEAFRDNPRRLAVMFGPLVLCAEAPPGKELPVILGEPGAVAAAVRHAAGGRLEFAMPGAILRIPGEADPADALLLPFYRMYKQPYIVYWDVLTDEQWKACQAAHRAEAERRQRLAARMVDEVVIGQADSERAHDVRGERTGAGEFAGRRWRHATDGGWFSFRMRTLPDAPLELLVTYWGSDSGPRTFDILLDNVKLTTEKLANNRPGEFYDQVYPIPPDLTRGKQAVTVRFQGRPGNYAGGIFGIVVLMRE